MALRVGVAGLGIVGARTVTLLREASAEFQRRLGVKVEVAAVCDRRVAAKAKFLKLPASVRRTTRWADLARDPSLHVVVETIGGLGAARGLVLESLKRGKRVVTANKRLLAHHWDEVFAASRASGASVRFEASVAGGIPLLEAVDQSLAANRVRRVLGILNGTTNYILSRMEREGLDLGPALKEAQRLGLAERDPGMDLDGTDAAHKVAVLAALLTGRGVKPESVARSGILGIGAADIRFAKEELGRAARLLGVVEIDWNARPHRVTAFVAPTLVPAEHPLAGVHGEYNAVMVQASAAGDLLFYGKGAGPGPAASAVAGDVFMACRGLLQGKDAPRPAPGPKPELAGIEGTRSAFYLRLEAKDRPGVLSRITGILGRHGISIAQIHQDRQAEGRAGVPVFITTHPTGHGGMARAVRSVLALPQVSRSHTWLRML